MCPSVEKAADKFIAFVPCLYHSETEKAEGAKVILHGQFRKKSMIN